MKLMTQVEAFQWMSRHHGVQARKRRGLCFCCAGSPRKQAGGKKKKKPQSA